MRSFKNLTYLFVFLTLVAFTSCDKDDDNNSPTKRDLLTAGTWTGVAIYADGEDYTQKLIDTEKYDFKKQTWKYEKDGKYSNTYDRKTFTGSWEFVDEEQAILHDKESEFEMNTRVVKLTDKELYLEYIHRSKVYEERYTR